MKSRDFAYWLQGYFEIHSEFSNEGLTVNQVNLIKQHLQLVFKYEIDPSIDEGDPVKKKVYDDIHSGDILIRC